MYDVRNTRTLNLGKSADYAQSIIPDFGHVKKEDMEQLIRLVRGDSHTMVEYITVSGRGFRVFCAYHPVDDDDISVLELFNAVLQKAMAYYTQLLGIAPDKQCVDITRCAGLAYDPDAYFRWDAEPLPWDRRI